MKEKISDKQFSEGEYLCAFCTVDRAKNNEHDEYYCDDVNFNCEKYNKLQNEYSNYLEEKTGKLKTQLDIANKKLDEIEGYAKLRNDELNDFKKSTINDSFNVNIEKFIKDILSIMGSNNIQKCSLYNTDLKSYTDNKTQTIGGE